MGIFCVSADALLSGLIVRGFFPFLLHSGSLPCHRKGLHPTAINLLLATATAGSSVSALLRCEGAGLLGFCRDGAATCRPADVFDAREKSQIAM